MKLFALSIIAILALIGCASRTEKLVTSDIILRHGTNEIIIKNPKDVSFDDAMINPVDGTFRIRKYRSTANEAAIAAAERQAEAQIMMLQGMKEQFERGAEIAARMYGIPVPLHSQPVSILRTNYPPK